MELKTVEIINKICRLDSEVLPTVLLKQYETIVWLYSRFDNQEELNECLKSLGLIKFVDVNELLLYLGFSNEDKIASDIICNYFSLEDENRMGILKKQLIEWAIKLEDAENTYERSI